MSLQIYIQGVRLETELYLTHCKFTDLEELSNITAI